MSNLLHSNSSTSSNSIDPSTFPFKLKSYSSSSSPLKDPRSVYYSETNSSLFKHSNVEQGSRKTNDLKTNSSMNNHRGGRYQRGYIPGCNGYKNFYSHCQFSPYPLSSSLYGSASCLYPTDSGANWNRSNLFEST